MALNKRGMFFTLIALALISLFFISYSLYGLVENKSAINSRILTLDSFVKNVESDLAREIYIAGFRTLVVSQKQIAESGNYLANFNATVNELFLNGSLNGQSEPLMIGATLPELAEAWKESAKKVNANLNITNYTLRVYQDNPWEVIFEVQAHLFIVDEGNLVSWNKTEVIKARVPIDDFEDPLYTINTQSQVINKIKKTPYVNFASGSDVSNLSIHTTNLYYASNSLAPSYLDRLQGSTNPSIYGIESLVYLPKLSSAGITIKQKTVVDYLYFSNQNPVQHKITGMPNWFYLDDTHLESYNVTSLVIP